MDKPQSIYRPFIRRPSIRVTRRDLLLGMAGAGAAAALTTLGYRRFLTTEENPAEQMVPFWGNHQAGILTPSPAAALMVAFDTTAQTKADLMRLFKTLTDRIQFLMKGGTPPARDSRFPPSDSGVLGSNVVPDNLTITVGLGASLFDDRFGLAHLRPQHLTMMPGFSNDQLDPTLCHGDLLLQFCANTEEATIHALRDIIKNLPDLLTLRWQIAGFLPPKTEKHQGKTSVRNLLGFKDGTANLNADDERLMKQIVWVPPKSGEPDWAVNGTYQVVRVIRNRVERWDRTPLQEQEQIIGRSKGKGAPLGMKEEHDIPNYANDPQGKQIPLDAHIRLANPRTKTANASLILRRGFNYSRGFDASGQLDMGLLFVCFQANLQKGFVTVQNRLKGEPLEEYITPIGGGYFFDLPGVSNAKSYLGQSLLAAASAEIPVPD